MPPQSTSRSGPPSAAFWQVLDHAGDGYAVVNLTENRVLRANPAWERRSETLGIRMEELAKVLIHQPEVEEDSPPKSFRWFTSTPSNGPPVRLGATPTSESQETWLLLLSSEHVASEDVVTGVADRRLLQQELEARFESGRHFATLFVDLDGFKQVNDQLGHTAGDLALRQIAQRIRGCLRDEDLVGRFGGDEFVVLVDGAKTEEDLKPIIDRLNDAASQPLETVPEDFDLSASIGWAFASGGFQDAAEMLASADMQMYARKRVRDADPPDCRAS